MFYSHNVPIDILQAILAPFLHGSTSDADSDDLTDEWDGYDLDIDEDNSEDDGDLNSDQETEEGREESDEVQVLALEREINKTYKVSAEQMATGKSALSKVRDTLLFKYSDANV